MATISVKYKTTLIQTLDWPDDELKDLNYENLLCNLDSVESFSTGDFEIEKIELNGKDYQF